MSLQEKIDNERAEERENTLLEVASSFGITVEELKGRLDQSRSSGARKSENVGKGVSKLRL